MKNKNAAKAILDKGPAIEIRNSCMGFSGILSIDAIPPIGKSVISLTLIPNFCATMLCISSWNTTQVNTISTSTMDLNPDVIRKRMGSKRKVMWILMDIPKILNNLIEPFMLKPFGYFSNDFSIFVFCGPDNSDIQVFLRKSLRGSFKDVIYGNLLNFS